MRYPVLLRDARARDGLRRDHVLHDRRHPAAQKGLAEDVHPKAGGKSAAEFIQEALEAGVTFTACTAATELHDLQVSDLIDGVKMVGGAAMWQMAEESKTVLTF
ncbi:MAG: DsrE/DsrF/DrsH-like family protein [Kouleothrix sp.]|nr:DsrE/DsrF/DrsH-like family protein [Kouleothrix sp.]